MLTATDHRRAFFASRTAGIVRPSDPRDIAGQALVMLDRRVAPGLALELSEAVYAQGVASLRLEQWRHAGCAHEDVVSCVAGHKQPDSIFGNVETILDGALPGAFRAVAKLAAVYKKKVKGQTSAATINSALIDARQSLDARAVANAMERHMIHAAAVGALDSAAETALDDPSIGEERIEDVIARGDEISEALASRFMLVAGDPRDVSKMRFPAAVKYFESQQVVTRAEFDALSQRARQRAFTVTGVLNDSMLTTIQAELTKQIAAGSALIDFEKFIDARLKSAGFVASLEGSGTLSASHIETVYRTNTLNAYNAGRATEMQANVEARPVWEIRVVRDGGTRPTHRAVHNVRLLASDPFWLKAYTPFGWNCRCRVISKGPSFVGSVVSGSTITGLPDPGFTSGVPNLL